MPGSLKLLTESGGSLTIAPTDTGSSYTMALPSSSDTITTNTATQILSNKTLTNPIMNGFTGNTSTVNIGSGQFYKDTSGNIGIGTTSPSYALEVHKSMMIRGNNSSGTEYQDWPECSFNIRRSDDFSVNGITMASFGYRNDPSYFTDSAVCNIRIWDNTQPASATTSASTTKMTLGSPGSFSILTGNSAERLLIDSSGRVTLPYQPAFYAWMNNSTYNFTGGSALVFNTTRFNVGSHYNTSNGRFTAPVAGVYIFTATVANDPDGAIEGKYFSFYRSGSRIDGRDISEAEIGSQTTHYEQHATWIAQLNAGDYIEIVPSASGTFSNGSDGSAYRNQFSGYFLG